MQAAPMSDVTGRAAPDVVNAHVHVPPNFSAFVTVEEAVAFAAAGGARAVGVSNFHDRRVYARFRRAAAQAGIEPLFGVEFVTLVEPLRASGVRVNDPENPGRMYLCGKGVNAALPLSPAGRATMADARARDAARARVMVDRLRDHLAAAGLATSLDATAIVGGVAERAGVPTDWVVLQERHVAMAFQEVLFRELPPERRAAVLERAFGARPVSSVDDPVAVQGEIRSRLLKVGGPAFVDETALAYEDARRVVVELDGIPAYPTLADGASPVCPFEDPPGALADRLVEMGFGIAELIPTRNEPAVVDAYVRAFRSAGIAVTAGTEHNTLEQIPIRPGCRGGAPLSAYADEVFYEGACVIIGHQHERRLGRAGFVDRDGRPGGPDRDALIRRFAAIGAAHLAGERAS
jgi:hypothetical protein